MSQRFCVMLEINTRNPKLQDIQTTLNSHTVKGFASIRAAILAVLPRDVTRVVAVFPVEHARLLMMLHEAVGEDLGADAWNRPPADYVPPTRD